MTKAVDVETDTIIHRAVDEVAAFAAAPENATKWYTNIKQAEWVDRAPLAKGSHFRFTAQFLGRRLTYTYEVTEYLPGKRMVMRTAEGPFPMDTTYTWSAAPDGATRMALRNRGEPRGFSKIMAPIMESAMRKANRNDLARLKRILESGPK